MFLQKETGEGVNCMAEETKHGEISEILADIYSKEEMELFLSEILTPKELEDVALRWQLMKDLYSGSTQRSIAKRHKISLCKITRGSKQLKKDQSLSLKILKRQYGLVQK
jgi:TrpR family trp operon transcriptional repressor